MKLFGSKKKKKPGYSYFANGVTIEGRLCFDGIIRFDGRLNGEIVSVGTLVIEETAVITGSIMGENIILSGTVCGDIQASKQLHLNPMAKVYGQISYNDLSFEGALHEGGSHKMAPDEAERLQQRCLEMIEEVAANTEKAWQANRNGLDSGISAQTPLAAAQPQTPTISTTASPAVSIAATPATAVLPRNGQTDKTVAETKPAAESAAATISHTIRIPENAPKPSEATATLRISDPLPISNGKNGHVKKVAPVVKAKGAAEKA